MFTPRIRIHFLTAPTMTTPTMIALTIPIFLTALTSSTAPSFETILPTLTPSTTLTTLSVLPTPTPTPTPRPLPLATATATATIFARTFYPSIAV